MIEFIQLFIIFLSNSSPFRAVCNCVYGTTAAASGAWGEESEKSSFRLIYPRNPHGPRLFFPYTQSKSDLVFVPPYETSYNTHHSIRKKQSGRQYVICFVTFDYHDY